MISPFYHFQQFNEKKHCFSIHFCIGAQISFQPRILIIFEHKNKAKTNLFSLKLPTSIIANVSHNSKEEITSYFCKSLF